MPGQSRCSRRCGSLRAVTVQCSRRRCNLKVPGLRAGQCRLGGPGALEGSGRAAVAAAAARPAADPRAGPGLAPTGEFRPQQRRAGPGRRRRWLHGRLQLDLKPGTWAFQVQVSRARVRRQAGGSPGRVSHALAPRHESAVPATLTQSMMRPSTLPGGEKGPTTDSDRAGPGRAEPRLPLRSSSPRHRDVTRRAGGRP